MLHIDVDEVDANAIKNKFLSRKKSTLAAFEHTHVTTNKFPGLQIFLICVHISALFNA